MHKQLTELGNSRRDYLQAVINGHSTSAPNPQPTPSSVWSSRPVKTNKQPSSNGPAREKRAWEKWNYGLDFVFLKKATTKYVS
ncbi:MAG: hypothetical protein DLM72_12735 [Candidatus Nitrosopolaris wilkensis]|nr:MAG: hypothetical protein DLM72_12735 [Candidatus Nitrosopolaris wilkensis]